MTIWILAFLVIACTALAGWRQGGIRASIAFVGIFFSLLLAGLVGKLFHFLLPFLGTSNPLLVWALSPICGFILVTIVFAIVGFNVHRKVDVYYKYQAGDLRLALWERLNSRLGICVGVLNGAIYFVLISFVVFHLSYLTTQVTAGASQPAWSVRLMNNLGNDMQSAGISRVATAVGTLPPTYYKLSNLSGFLMQNPQTAPRLAAYPALTSLWERLEMQPLVTDSTLTNALASGASLGEIINLPSVQDFLKNKDLTKLVSGIIESNVDDLTEYMKTGKSARFDSEKIIGSWEFNPVVTMAWFRQSQPKIQSKEMAAIRALWWAAYGQTKVLVTGDNQVFIKNLPHFQNQPGQPPFTPETWNGDWSRDGDSYTLHLTSNGQDKFLTATTTDGLRLSVKDGRNLLVFDHVD